MTDEHIIVELAKLPSEGGWVEFKVNKVDPDQVGKNCSALSNSARLADKEFAYLVFGIKDKTHELVGTKVTTESLRQGNEEFPNWLANLLSPHLNVEITPIEHEGKNFIVLRIPAAYQSPVQFKKTAYIRIGSATRLLADFPDSERMLWQKCSNVSFENSIARASVAVSEISQLLNISSYYRLLKQESDQEDNTVLERLISERMIVSGLGDKYSITNVGSLLIGTDLSQFAGLRRKGIRIITYDGNTRLNALRERVGKRGYAHSFENIIEYIQGQLPLRERISDALRTIEGVYPTVAIREFVANALIHQDLSVTGSGPMVEIFDDLIEISNPGPPLVHHLRLMDNNPVSRNETLAAFMRRSGICEERGSGIDRAFFHIERADLPAPDFQVTDTHTRVVLYGPKKFAELTKTERIKTAYWHCCLRYLSKDYMTNASLRERLGIAKQNYPMASQVIADAKEEEFIKDFDPNNKAPRYAKYIPFWA